MSEEQNLYEEHHSQRSQEKELPEEIAPNPEMDNAILDSQSISKKLKNGHELISEEDNKTYLLKFISLSNNLKITLSEQDTFPAKIYELYLDLEELKLKNNLFSIYNSTKELSEELNKSDNKINYSIRKKPENIMALTIVFPSENENEDNDIEIDLNENIIDDREMFRQLFEKYKSIQQEQEEDISQFMTRIQKIEEILASQQKEQQPEENQENPENPEGQAEENKAEGENLEAKVEEDKKSIQQPEVEAEVREIKSSKKSSKKSIKKEKEKNDNLQKSNIGKNNNREKKIFKKKKK